jgi:acyl dehydratase
MSEARYFDDVQLGERFESGGRTVTEADIVGFAGLSGDFHSLHMDAEYAAKTPHGQRIAHGLLVLSMMSGLAARLPIMRAIERATLGVAGIECRFLKPVFIGDTIRVQVEIAGKTPGRKPDRGTLAMRRTALNQRGEAVLEATWQIVLRRNASPG